QQPALPAADQPGPGEQPPPRLDLHGDPLPPGVLARLGTLRFRQGDVIHRVVFSPDGKELVSASYDGTVRVWDRATGKGLLRIGGGDLKLFALALAPDGRTVAAGGENNILGLWDRATGKLVRRFVGHRGTERNTDKPGSVFSVAFSPTGETLASLSLEEAVV